jgi:DNA-binding CsgD family transcriptional regulator/tetratricopeptide (TPR) repeat protein
VEQATASRDPLLVGRQRELEMLTSQFDAAAGGRTRVALVAGEPGIGKTRLLLAVAARAAGKGALVLRGGASDAEGMPPYLPFLEALGQHIRIATPDTLRAQAGSVAPVLATILPELAQRLGELPPSYPLPPEQARLRLYEAVGDYLAACAAPRAMLLILDDLHWADPASLDLLCHVARRQPTARLLILAAYREGEVMHRPSFNRALAELTRLRMLDMLALGPLTDQEVADLAAGQLGAPLDAAAIRLLGAHCEGVPFFAEELVRGWLETGALAQTAGDAQSSTYRLTTAAEPALPPSIMGAVRQRLAHQAPEVLELLQTAAIIGRTFDITVLAEVMGREPELVELALQEAVLARLLVIDADATVSFGHDKIRECLYQEVTTTRRRRLHGFIGRALEARPDAAESRRLADLAFHFARSGDRARGAEYALSAAQHAMNAFASDEAMAHYRQARELIDAGDARRGELLLGLGEAAALAGVEREAATSFAAAKAWFEQEGQPLSAARAAHRAGQVLARLEEHRAALENYEAAVSLLEGNPRPELVRVLVDLGTLLAVSLHEQTAGIAHCGRALELATHLADDLLLAAACRALGNLLMRSNDLAEGIPLLERALSLATAADEPVEAAECCACLAPAYFWQGAIERSRQTTLRRLEFAQRCRDPFQLRHIYTWLAMLAGVQGRLAEAEQLLDREQVIVDRLASPEPRAWLQFCRGALAYERGDFAMADARLQEAMVMFRAIGPGTLVWYLGFLGMAHAALGKMVEVCACIDELEALLKALPPGTMPTAEPLAYLTQIALALGDRERLTRYHKQLAPFQGQFRDLLIDRLLGEIETGQGDWAAAHDHLVAAEAVARREALVHELVRTMEAQADLALARRGRTSIVHAWERLEHAAGQIQGLGNAAEERRLRGRLRSLGLPASQRPRIPAGLSAREAEVLHLVAAGKSNREIAGTLCLSESTVAHHLTSIFTKTGVDNRAAATAWAIHHELA